MFDVLDNHRAHSATGGGQGHHHSQVMTAIQQARQAFFIDQAQLNDIDRDFWVIASTQLGVDLIQNFVVTQVCGAGQTGGFRGLDIQRGHACGCDSIQIALPFDGQAFAECLGDLDLGVGRQFRGGSSGHSIDGDRAAGGQRIPSI